MRQEITKYLNRFIYLESSSFGSIRKQMAEIEADHPEYIDFEIQMEHKDYYSEHKSPAVYGVRLETQEESEKRIAQQKAQEMARQEKQWREYQRLKAMFEENT